jgi:hypothetical protein
MEWAAPQKAQPDPEHRHAMIPAHRPRPPRGPPGASRDHGSPRLGGISP